MVRLDLSNLTSTQLAIIGLIKAKDKSGKEDTPIPGRIHLVKELFAISTTELGSKLLGELRFEADNYGPYDETILAALDALCDAHIVTCVPSKNRATIELTKEGKKLADDAWSRMKAPIKDLFNYVKITYNHKSSEAVLEDIYSAFPEMTINSVSKVADKYRPKGSDED